MHILELPCVLMHDGLTCLGVFSSANRGRVYDALSLHALTNVHLLCSIFNILTCFGYAVTGDELSGATPTRACTCVQDLPSTCGFDGSRVYRCGAEITFSYVVSTG